MRALLLIGLFVNLLMAERMLLGAELESIEKDLVRIFPEFNFEEFGDVIETCKEDRDYAIDKFKVDPIAQTEVDSYTALFYSTYTMAVIDTLCAVSRGGLGRTINRVDSDFIENYLLRTIGDMDFLKRRSETFHRLLQK